MKVTFHGKLVASREELYTLYVFQNLDEPNNSLMRYITVTRPPNWSNANPDIGDIGYIECEYVDAGDEYYKRDSGNKETYKYTQCYFLNFIKDKDKVDNNFKF